MTEMTPPNEWVKCAIGDVCALNPKVQLSDDLDIGFMPMSGMPTKYLGTCQFEERKWEKAKKGFTQFKNGDIAFAKITPCFENSKAAIVKDFPNEWGAGSTEYYVLRPYGGLVKPEILYALVKSKDFMINGAMNMSGSVGHKRVPKDFVSGYEFSLPPLAEQKVIADKLDTLLAQVDNTKARLERIPEILKRFRQSVLAAAVSGQLTEEWRGNKTHIPSPSIKELEEYWANIYSAAGKKPPQIKALYSKEKADIPNSWFDTSIGVVFDVFVGSTPSRSEKSYWNGDIHWVSSSEVAFCHIKSTKEKITESGLSSASTSMHPPGTVMLAMIGQGKTRGQVAILDIDACHNQNTAALRVPEGFVASKYLYYYLTQQYEETRRVGGGNNQKALNKKVIQAMRFPMPTYKEQTEIVRRVDQLFAYANTVERQVNSALERVNQLTQSILAKAFRGELTAQWREDHPELISGENSAEALLERIKAERAAQAPKKRPRKKATT